MCTSQSSVTKIEPFACNGGTVIRNLNSFAVLGYNIEILNVPGRDDTCKNR